MTEAQWLASDDPARMLYVVQGPAPQWGGFPTRKISDRKLRLFACAMALLHRDEPGLHLDDYLKVLDDDGKSECWQQSGGAIGVATAWCRLFGTAQTATLLRDIVGNPWRPVTLGRQWLACERCNGVSLDDHGCPCRYSRLRDAGPLAQAAYDERPGARKCRRCNGNRVVMDGREPDGTARCSMCPDCRQTGHIDDGTLDPARLALLADALEDARCIGEWGPLLVRQTPRSIGHIEHGYQPHPIVAHLRDAGPHVRGCHVVDAILGKE